MTHDKHRHESASGGPGARGPGPAEGPSQLATWEPAGPRPPVHPRWHRPHALPPPLAGCGAEGGVPTLPCLASADGPLPTLSTRQGAPAQTAPRKGQAPATALLTSRMFHSESASGAACPRPPRQRRRSGRGESSCGGAKLTPKAVAQGRHGRDRVGRCVPLGLPPPAWPRGGCDRPQIPLSSGWPRAQAPLPGCSLSLSSAPR